jgi:hypothetical protein
MPATTRATATSRALVTNFSQDYNVLYRNLGPALQGREPAVGTHGGRGPYLGWGAGFVDLDNDGLLDLFVANGHVYPDVQETGTSTYRQRNQVFRNSGAAVPARHRDRRRRPARGGVDPRRGVRRLRQHGHVDVLLVNMDATPTLLRNDTAGGNWITLRLEGTDEQSRRHRRPGDGGGRRPAPDDGGAQRRQLHLAQRHAGPVRTGRAAARRSAGDSLAERPRGDRDGPSGESLLRRPRGERRPPRAIAWRARSHAPRRPGTRPAIPAISRD